MSINLGNIPFSLILDGGGKGLGGTGPNYTSAVGIKLFAFDDNSCVYIADYGPQNGPHGQTDRFDIYVIDISGAYTWYTGGQVNGINPYLTSIVNFGPGNFIITNRLGNVWHAKVANQKLNNSSPILIPQSSTPFSNSCYDAGGTHSVYYDAVKSLLAVSWYEAVGQNGTDIFSTVYSVDPLTGNLAKVSDGFTAYACPGCVPSVPDSYDLTQNSIPGGVNSSGQQSNGLNVGLAGNNPKILYRQSFEVDYGAAGATCNDSNGNTVRTRASDSFSINVGSGGTNAYLLDTNVSGLTGIFDTNGGTEGTLYLVGDNLVSFFATPSGPGGGISSPNSFVVTKKYVFAGFTEGGYNGAICAAAIGGIYNGYNAQKRGIGLINGVRPISVSGKYKA